MKVLMATIGLVLFLFADFVEAAAASEKARYTCDFQPVGWMPTGRAALGKLAFDIDLSERDIVVSCLSENCLLDGDHQTIQLIRNFSPEMREFSADPDDSAPRFIAYGSNGDDSEFMVLFNHDRMASLTLMTDGNLDGTTAPILCDIALRQQ